MNIEKESDEEREVFERLQRDNALQALHDENERLGLYKDVYGEKSAQFMSISVDDYMKLSDELALARVLIRELGDRLAKLEKPWVGLTEEEVAEIIDAEIGFNSCWGPEEAFARAIEAKLKEKNT